MADQDRQDSQVRVLLAQFMFKHDIDHEAIYRALGADLATADAEAVYHMAGIIDGVTLASTKIRAHGVDDWMKH